MVEVGGGDDGSPCSAGVLDDWSGDGFVSVNECFLVFALCCTGDLVLVYFICSAYVSPDLWGCKGNCKDEVHYALPSKTEGRLENDE